MTLLRLQGTMGTAEWLRRERQEACAHQFASGTVNALRLDPERGDYTIGPTYRRVCFKCDLVIDKAVPNAPLVDRIAQNTPSQRWLKEHRYQQWQIEEREVGNRDTVNTQYERDQSVRATVRARRKTTGA